MTDTGTSDGGASGATSAGGSGPASGTPAAGGGTAASGGAAGAPGAGGAESAPWYGDIEKEGAVYLEKNGFKSWGDVVKSARHLESLVGADKNTILKLPADRSDPKAMEPVFKALGKPDNVAGYGIKEDAALGLEGPNLAAFGDTALKLDLLPYQVQGILKWYGEGVQGALGQSEAAIDAQRNAVVADLKKEWGAAADDKIAAANSLVREYGGPELADHLVKTGLGNNAALIKMIATLAEKVSDPSTLPGAGNGRDTQGGGKMTPMEAEAKLREFETANATGLSDRTHPDHKQLVTARENLIRRTIPR